MGNPQSVTPPSCPRCRTDAQFLGDGYDGESNWFLCPTCRYAWQRKNGEAAAKHRGWRLDDPRYRATA